MNKWYIAIHNSTGNYFRWMYGGEVEVCGYLTDDISEASRFQSERVAIETVCEAKNIPSQTKLKGCGFYINQFNIIEFEV